MNENIEERTLKALEFFKILDILSGFCNSSLGRKAALDLRPLSSMDQIDEDNRILLDAHTWIAASSHNSTDISPSDNKISNFQVKDFQNLIPALNSIATTAQALELDELWVIRGVLRMLNQILTSINQPKTSEMWPNLYNYCKQYIIPEQSLNSLNRCINEDGYIKDESSPALKQVRNDLRSLNQSCMNKVKDFAIKYNFAPYLQDEFMTLSSDRYVLPIKANFKGKIQGIIHDWSQTGETYYLEPMFLIEINNNLQELKNQERLEEYKVLLYLTSIIKSEIDEIIKAQTFLIYIDILLAKCQLSNSLSGQCIFFADEASISLIHARHPLLVLAEPNVQAIDIKLDKKDKALIISGGNAGGKTVCLKTLGLITLMALTALPVPVDKGSTLPPFKQVFAFIGDEQSLENHVSTFTAQIQNLTNAWQKANAQTLILLDEFGAGTDPTQGAALAQAAIDDLIERQAYVIAATHFPALKIYALTQDKVRAASVLFDPKTKQPLFKLAYDQVGSSQAIDVAKEHGLPPSIIARAEQYLSLGEDDISKLIERLNLLTVEREQEIEKYKNELALLEKEKKVFQADFDNKSKIFFAELKSQSTNIIHEWKERKIGHKQALKEMATLRASLVKTEAKKPDTVAKDFFIGQTVKHISFQKTAIITDLNSHKNKARIDMNGISLWANLHEIEIVKINSAPSLNTSTTILRNNTSFSIDLRGKRVDVALAELEHFLDNAYMNDMDSVELIHGRGTGVLRKQIHAFLKHCGNIKKFSLAPEDRGGDGMTIVQFNT